MLRANAKEIIEIINVDLNAGCDEIVHAYFWVYFRFIRLTLYV